MSSQEIVDLDLAPSLHNEDDAQLKSFVQARLDAGKFMRGRVRHNSFFHVGFFKQPLPNTLYREVYTSTQQRTHCWWPFMTFMDWLNDEFSLIQGLDYASLLAKLNDSSGAAKKSLETFFMDPEQGHLPVIHVQHGLYSFNNGMYDYMTNRYYRYGSTAYKKYSEGSNIYADGYADKDFDEEGFVIETGEFNPPSFENI